MRLRFLCVVPSSNPAYPFQPGQIIEAPKLTADMKRWVKDGVATLVHEHDEVAVVEAPERAVKDR